MPSHYKDKNKGKNKKKETKEEKSFLASFFGTREDRDISDALRRGDEMAELDEQISGHTTQTPEEKKARDERLRKYREGKDKAGKPDSSGKLHRQRIFRKL